MSEFVCIKGTHIRKSKIDCWEIKTDYSSHYDPYTIVIIMDGETYYFTEIGEKQLKEHKKQLEEL